MDWDKISNLYRGPSINDSYQGSSTALTEDPFSQSKNPRILFTLLHLS